MRIGIPKEIKIRETRVALVPPACRVLSQLGHEVYIEKSAGEGAGFSDDEYRNNGARLLTTASEVYAQVELIVKVKEPQPSEWQYLRSDHTLFGYLHLAADPLLTETLIQIGLTAIGFETVQVEERTPLLAPMSAIAGRLSVQLGAYYLHASHGGRGVLLGGTQSGSEGRVTVIGAGVAGTEAIALAYQMGAAVTVLDINPTRLQALMSQYPGIKVALSSPQTIAETLTDTDLLIGAVYIPGKKAPKVVSDAMVTQMPKGSVIVDIAIDQGGCIETSRPGTYDSPYYNHHGVIHCAIANLPAAVPHSASIALSTAILPYVEKLASGQWTDALLRGINVASHQLKLGPTPDL